MTQDESKGPSMFNTGVLSEGTELASGRAGWRSIARKAFRALRSPLLCPAAIVLMASSATRLRSFSAHVSFTGWLHIDMKPLWPPLHCHRNSEFLL